MKMKYIHISLSLKQNSDRLAGFLPAKCSGCDMYLYEIEV